MSDSIEEYNRKSNEFTSNYSANSATEEMEELSKFDISTSNEIVGTGRGRGRGAGVPLLPEGFAIKIHFYTFLLMAEFIL